jgi:putative hydrolase of the HAD superfamily
MIEIRAVIFDLGGVVLDSPLHAIARYERAHDIPGGFINRVVVDCGPGGAWSRMERGELDMESFFEPFEKDCRDAGQAISARGLMETIGANAGPRPAMLEAIGSIRQSGLVAAALTNNWTSAETTAAAEPNSSKALAPHFDFFIESSVVGLRKPDPRIYQHACDTIGIEPAEAVFLDDIGRNLKTARQMGMTTIKVEDPTVALDELQSILGFPLATR